MAKTTMPDLKRILVTGASGQLGRSLKTIADTYPGFLFVFTQREQLDLADNNAIEFFFDEYEFDFIINCAAHTAVDKAEAELELAEQLNHYAIKKIAETAKNKDIKLIHISTDYVFNGENYKPYIEEDSVEPQGVYGASKLSGEKAILSTLPTNAVVIRTSWVYSEFGNNFVKTMLRLGAERDALNVIFDQVGSPTYAKDLAEAIMVIVSSEQFSQSEFTSQIYHFSNEGVCSWYDFAKTIFAINDIDCSVSPIETKDYPTPAKRPHYSVLNKTKIKQDFGITIPYWMDSLKRCLDKLQEQK